MEFSTEWLQSVPLFAGVDETALAAALASAKTETLAAGTVCDVSRAYLGVLLTGSGQIRSADADRTVILRNLQQGDVFGAAALFAGEPTPLSRFVAAEKCACLYLPAEAVRALLAADATFLSRYLSFLAGRVCFLNRKIRSFTAGSAVRRVALWLAAEEHDAVTLPASLSDFADMLDIGRASLYRAFDTLEAQGLVRRSGRRIFILDREKLTHITQ